MKRLVYYLIAIFVVCACMFDMGNPVPVEDKDLQDGSPVTITFSVPGIRIPPSTKESEGSSKGDITGEPYLDPDKLFLVVCGGTQSIRYVRKAELVLENGQPKVERIYKNTDPERYNELNYPSEARTESPEYVDLYYFNVQLELSDSKRTIHFLGNIDENQLITGSYSYQVLPYLMSAEGKQAYWQKVITSITTDDINPDPETGCYSPDNKTRNNFKYVPLIRNYAEIKVTNDAYLFKLHSYAVIFTPKKGSVVPFRHNLLFNSQSADAQFSFTDDPNYILSGYERCTLDSLESKDKFNYPGNLPAGADFTGVADIPDASEFLDPDHSVNGRVIKYTGDPNAHGFYIYEREIPSDNRQPTFIILCGRFLKEGESAEDVEDEKFLYYRMDLIDSKTSDADQTAQYYPIYRNFKYDIHLKRVASIGVADPLSAYLSTGAEDISADPSMKHLNDISNGTSRLVVEPYMMRTFIGPHPNTNIGEVYELYVRFFEDINNPIATIRQNAVQVTLEPVDSLDPSIENIVVLYNDNGASVSRFNPRSQTKDGEPGYRFIRFNLKNPSDVTRKQIIKITGSNSKVHEPFPLYREVEITLQKKQEMEVDCNRKLPASKGFPQTVSVSVPDTLGESMFPLEFIFEAESMSLTPRIPSGPVSSSEMPCYNLPVKSGTSLSGSGKTTFQFIRTLTWDEYCSLPSSNGQKTFLSYFRSNRDHSATTIMVANEYFIQTQVAFTNSAASFYIEARADCKVSSRNAMRYAIDDGAWKDYEDEEEVSLTTGQRMYIVSTEKDWSYKNNKTPISVTGAFDIGGSLASLIEGDNFIDEEQVADASGWTFNGFMQGTKVEDASALELPMLTVPEKGYEGMFSGCTKLTAPPSLLPAKTLNYHAYYQMFFNCTALSTAPEFPHDENETYIVRGDSTCYQMFYKCSFTNLTGQLFNASVTLSNACFQDMFSTCASLSTIPDNYLPATNLSANCYRGMFQSTAITRAPELLAETLKSASYRYMFYGCKSLSYIKCLAKNPGTATTLNFTAGGLPGSGTFVKKAGISWPSGVNGIPSGWTVEQYPPQ